MKKIKYLLIICLGLYSFSLHSFSKNTMPTNISILQQKADKGDAELNML